MNNGCKAILGVLVLLVVAMLPICGTIYLFKGTTCDKFHYDDRVLVTDGFYYGRIGDARYGNTPGKLAVYLDNVGLVEVKCANLTRIR